jgi:hypothetical protein
VIGFGSDLSKYIAEAQSFMTHPIGFCAAINFHERHSFVDDFISFNAFVAGSSLN